MNAILANGTPKEIADLALALQGPPPKKEMVDISLNGKRLIDVLQGNPD